MKFSEYLNKNSSFLIFSTIIGFLVAHVFIASEIPYDGEVLWFFIFVVFTHAVLYVLVLVIWHEAIGSPPLYTMIYRSLIFAAVEELIRIMFLITGNGFGVSGLPFLIYLSSILTGTFITYCIYKVKTYEHKQKSNKNQKLLIDEESSNKSNAELIHEYSKAYKKNDTQKQLEVNINLIHIIGDTILENNDKFSNSFYYLETVINNIDNIFDQETKNMIKKSAAAILKVNFTANLNLAKILLENSGVVTLTTMDESTLNQIITRNEIATKDIEKIIEKGLARDRALITISEKKDKEKAELELKNALKFLG